MFGYIMINKPEMKIREFDVYHSYYCGLCRRLKDLYGVRGQMTLSYDMTFLDVLLGSLYEPEDTHVTERCIMHPLQKHHARYNRYTDYVADMNVLLSFFKCRDDWADEKKLHKWLAAKLLERKCRARMKQYGGKLSQVEELLAKITELEKSGTTDIDLMGGLFGEVMAVLFTPKEDEWTDALEKIGFYLGKFVYLMDAYEDLEEDLKKGRYNPFTKKCTEPEFDEDVHSLLTMLMAQCAGAYEMLPIVENTEILRNILYAGVWGRFGLVRQRRLKTDVQPDQSK